MGFAAVAMFSLTLPMTRLAVGESLDPQLSGWFVGFGRASVAGILSLVVMLLARRKLPSSRHLPLLAVTVGGVVLGFPLFVSLAMRSVEAVRAAVILAALPLTTAVFASLFRREKTSREFWGLAWAGFALLAGYLAFGGSGEGAFDFSRADLWVVLGMSCAAAGYVSGAGLSSDGMASWEAIGWALIFSLPVNLVGAWWNFPAVAVAPAAWAAFGYLSLFSMGIGICVWYKALALGGTVKISQIQLLQPLLSVVFAFPLLGEIPDLPTFVFGTAILLVVARIRKVPLPKKPENRNASGSGSRT